MHSIDVNKVVEILNKEVDGAKANAPKREGGDPVVFVDSEKVYDVCNILKNNSETDFQVLQVITGCDYLDMKASDDKPAQKARIEVSYMLTSYNKKHDLILKTELPRENPQVNSVVDIWSSANFQERECFDMLGVHFNNHPDPRRILCPDDWEGYPLRKDYKVQTSWHDMEVEPQAKMNIEERTKSSQHEL